MNRINAEVVICGAGFAGVSTAYFLSARLGISDVLLVDQFPPLSLTSDHSTECYRNWWPDKPMIDLMNRSIDLLEELAQYSGNLFHMNRRGYLYCSESPSAVDRFSTEAQRISSAGAGELCVHDGYGLAHAYQPSDPEGYSTKCDGADLLIDPELIQRYFPYLSKNVKTALHVRRAGWMSAQQLGMFLLDQARQSGTRFLQARICGIEASAGSVSAVRLDDGRVIQTRRFVNAAGPYIDEIGRMMDINLPIFNELHLKLAFNDNVGVLPRGAPLVIWSDPQQLKWTEDEREFLEENPNNQMLLHQLPAGVHTRPEGGPGSQMVLALWEYQTRLQEASYPIPEDPLYAEVVIRGLCRMIPGMQIYTQRMPRPRIDGGYYTRTRENRPLICKLPLEGAYLIGGLSGFGMMAACAAGELVAKQITEDSLPQYASAFDLTRYEDPIYLSDMIDRESSGQL